ncbi:ABC transporter ATP-binding protein [Algoriphagus sp. C2-6-M1]|uniref:ABC transporter ATP-binding protein n=1 Tax=Algoriphagus persicinus TaxID=3108754 RepID=UPI002B36A3C3|nr:ABC transporter ATP-binding protein [Algoriphagus sp. C2-6-M1]MEB2782425.1 ABC transporter ATP-binding protein [Algoriphagus sp. C2-6-M1]
MSSTVIKVENLSKRYRLGLREKQAETFAGQIGNLIKSPWKNLKRLQALNKFGQEDDSVFWALKDINFEVKEGEVLGIIGKNGAGKSTLLKILSQITEPTSGKIEIHGRVASLLEVGTGFHPELSGRENIYMNGTILGMTRREIDSKLDVIIDFSGVEKFIDTAVKFYSSGMKVRLGFSVAAHLEPEILIIDEVLAVGDYEFQKKCLGKMEDVAGNGRTVLFVSHNLQAVSTLTNKSLVLENGESLYLGDTEDGIATYLKSGRIGDSNYFGEDGKGICKVILQTSEPNKVQKFGEDLYVEITVDLQNSVKNPAISYQIFDEYENAIIHELFIASERNLVFSDTQLTIISKINNLKLYPGSYSLKIHYADNFTKVKIDTVSNVCNFKVEVMGVLRDYYWQLGAAKYVTEGEWFIK